MNEIKFNENYWTPIPGYYPYEAYPTGEIRNGRTKRILSPKTRKHNGQGYETTYQEVHPYINGKMVYRSVHRLIAMTFLPWPTGDINEYDVDHLDHDPTHNDILNLRWLPKKINRPLHADISPEARRRLVEDYFNSL